MRQIPIMNKINKYAKREKNKKLHDDDHFILKAAKKIIMIIYYYNISVTFKMYKKTALLPVQNDRKENNHYIIE